MADPTPLQDADPGEKVTKDAGKLPGPLDWRGVEEGGPKLWGEFCTWAEWYLRRFEIGEGTAPRCWRRHPVIVEELSALWTSFKCSYAEITTGSTPLVFLYQASLAANRMKASMSIYHCTRDHHAGPTTSRRVGEDVDFYDMKNAGLPEHVEVSATMNPERADRTYSKDEESELCHDTNHIGAGDA